MDTYADDLAQLMEKLHLKDAVLVGSLTKFNIYNPDRWQQEEARTAGENFGDLMRRLDI